MDVPFPTDVQEFDSDDRISFSKLDNKFIAVHDDGTEFEFDAELKRWTAIEEEPIDDDLDELREFSRTPADDAALDKKRKADSQNGGAVSFACSVGVPKAQHLWKPLLLWKTNIYPLLGQWNS